jgi:predicted Rdx family selenoprotein
LEANIIRDFEPDLASLTLRMYDDGRFKVFVDGQLIYDRERTGRFPNYEADVKQILSARADA